MYKNGTPNIQLDVPVFVKKYVSHADLCLPDGEEASLCSWKFFASLRMTLGKNCAFGTILQSIAKCCACCLFYALTCGQTKTALRWRFCRDSKEGT